jgi:hypothetical protein
MDHSAEKALDMQRQKMEGEGTWGGSGKPPPFSVEIVWRLGYQEYDSKA